MSETKQEVGLRYKLRAMLDDPAFVKAHAIQDGDWVMLRVNGDVRRGPDLYLLTRREIVADDADPEEVAFEEFPLRALDTDVLI